MEHVARCRCGAVEIVCEGEPVRVSVCHCRACQRRSGSAFSAQVRFPDDRVRISGETRSWETVGDSGKWGRFHFCPTCGAATHFRIEAMPGAIAVPLGMFDAPDFVPEFSVWESRKQPWVEITGPIEHD